MDKVDSGLDADLDIAVLAVSPHADDVVFAATAAGALHETTDGGTSWRMLDVPTEHVTTIAFVPDVPESVLVGDGHGRLFRSEDAGATWQPLPVAQDAGAINGIAASPEFTRDHTLFVAAERGVFSSTDGGTSFGAASDGISDMRMQSVVVSPNFADDSTVWTSSWNDGVYVSSDGGASWRGTARA